MSGAVFSYGAKEIMVGDLVGHLVFDDHISIEKSRYAGVDGVDDYEYDVLYAGSYLDVPEELLDCSVRVLIPCSDKFVLLLK